MLKKAFQMCYMLHKDQVDKGGQPYYLHPMFVALKMQSEDEKVVALLHDIVEDTDTTLDDLRREGFTERIIEAIDAITHREESYEDYINKVKTNKLATSVKIVDILHNLDTSRLKKITEKDIKRVQKYRKALHCLLID